MSFSLHPRHCCFKGKVLGFLRACKVLDLIAGQVSFPGEVTPREVNTILIPWFEILTKQGGGESILGDLEVRELGEKASVTARNISRVVWNWQWEDTFGAVAVIQARNTALQTRMTLEIEKGRLTQEVKWEGQQMELLGSGCE